MNVSVFMSAARPDLAAKVINGLHEFEMRNGHNITKNLVSVEDVQDTGIYAYCDGEFAGGLTYYVQSDWLFFLCGYVFPKFRHKGIYTEICKTAESYAKQNNLNGLFVSTHDFEAPAFYEQFGFTKGSVLPNCPTGNVNIDYFKIITG